MNPCQSPVKSQGRKRFFFYSIFIYCVLICVSGKNNFYYITFAYYVFDS